MKTFTATRWVERDELGERATAWLAAHRDFGIADIVVAQSSDATHHCVTIVVFYHRSAARRR